MAGPDERPDLPGPDWAWRIRLHTWRERVRASKRIPAEWQAALGRIANEQELGHYRHARQGILQACRRIEHHQDSARLAKRF